MCKLSRLYTPFQYAALAIEVMVTREKSGFVPLFFLFVTIFLKKKLLTVAPQTSKYVFRKRPMFTG